MQRDNGSFVAKARQRLVIAATLPASARVLEGFSGEGRIWRAAWSGFDGACIDKVEAKARDAAAARPRWACYSGDTERALLAGWMGHVPFDVVDLDAYGSPWPFFLAWCRSTRERATVTHVFLTDGYMDHADFTPRCRALFPSELGKRGDMPREVYLEHVRHAMDHWTIAFGATVEEFRTDAGRRPKVGGKTMRLHYARLSIPSNEGCRDDGAGAAHTDGIS